MSINQVIQDLRLFGYALRAENRKLFETMMSELEPGALQAAGIAKDPFEVVAMALIFEQQKMIKRLMEKKRKERP